MDLKFALAVLHFNVQYVAGGTFGFGVPALDRTAEQIEDQIVVESVEPVLDLFLAHPTWGHDIEMQGYMLDVIAARHPGVLAKLQKLTAAGQIEVMSFHYSDQLFLAFPRAAWDETTAWNEAAFANAGVPRSGAVFCQEGQSGVGMADAMRDHGYEVLVWPKNLWGYQHVEAPSLLYRFGDVRMITSNDMHVAVGGDTVDVTWTFVDDGELLATGGDNPYFPDAFHEKDKAIADYEAKLAALEAQGYAITTVSKYRAAVEQIVAPAEPPPLLDGTWQPGSTDGIQKWLGGRGLLFRDERDGDVRSLQALAQREIVVAEAIAKKAYGGKTPDTLGYAWRLLALGEVSDASGINPFRGEVEYGLAHAAEALRIARDVVRDAKAQLGLDGAWIDAADGSVTPGAPAEDLARPAVEPPIAVTASAGDRDASVRAEQIEAGHFLVTVESQAADEGDGTLSVTFAGAPGDVVYTPGLSSAPVHLPRSAFTFDHFYLALSDGLVGLGGGWYVVKDQASAHLAARITRGSGDVTFTDDTAHRDEAQKWRFHLVQGDDARALSVARGLNVTPRVQR